MPELSEQERRARADANAKEAAETHRLAAEARARDARLPPLQTTLAESIKRKLEREEFQKNEDS